MNELEKPTAARDRRPWVTPNLKPIGSLEQVLQGGGGKLSTTGGDPGEHRKQSGTG
jgi:hypothetical protein